MKICIVVEKEYLNTMLNTVNLSAFEIVAIVTDDRIATAERIYPADKIFAFWQIKDVVKKFEPDMILFLLQYRLPINFFTRTLKSINYSLDKICDLSGYVTSYITDLAEELYHVQQNPTAYKIFSTGISYSAVAIDNDSFELPLISFASASQDIYFDYKIAEKILPPPPRKI